MVEQLLEINPRHRISLESFCEMADKLYNEMSASTSQLPFPPADDDSRNEVAATAAAISQGMGEGGSGSGRGKSGATVDTTSLGDPRSASDSPVNKLPGV